MELDRCRHDGVSRAGRAMALVWLSGAAFGCAPSAGAAGDVDDLVVSCDLALEGDQLTVVVTNTSESPLRFYVLGTPFEPMGAGFDVFDGDGNVVSSDGFFESPPETAELMPGERADASRPLSRWDLVEGESYVARLAVDGIIRERPDGLDVVRLDCGEVGFVGPLRAAVEPLSVHPGCTAADALVMNAAFPLVESGLRIARGLLTTRSGVFVRWFGGPGENEAESIACAAGYIDQMIGSYLEHEFRCNNICCSAQTNGCTIYPDGDAEMSLCDAILDAPGAQLVDPMQVQGLTGTIIHEMGHAVGAHHAPDSLCGGGSGACSSRDGVLILASQPRNVTQWCDFHLPPVWVSINNAESYDRFVQDALRTTAVMLSSG